MRFAVVSCIRSCSGRRQIRRSREPEQKEERADADEQAGGESDRVALGRERREHERERQRGRRRREQMHPPSRDGGLVGPRPPHPPRRHAGEERPVGDEGEHVRRHTRRLRLSRGRERRDEERPDKEDRGREAEELLRAAGRPLERRREAEEEVREEHEQRDQQPLRRNLPEAGGVIGQQLRHVDDDGERRERHRRPEPGRARARPPQAQRDDGRERQEREVDPVKDVDDGAQPHPFSARDGRNCTV
jgi:hypothetical protein